MKWFIHSNGRQEGPYFPEELQKKITEGKVIQDTHVWKPGMPSWKKLREVPELVELFNTAASRKTAVPAAPAPIPARAPMQVDELSVFVELPKTAEEVPPELPASHAAKLGKEAKKAQRIAKTTETIKTSKQVLPRIAMVLATVCVLLGGVIAYLSFSKHDLDPISGISATDFARLKAAALAPASSGNKVEIAASTDDLAHPRIHIASNLSNGTRFSVTLRGIPGTLVRPLSQPATLQTPPQKNHHAATDRLELPKGEYQVEVTPEGESTAVANGTYFLGGTKDADYESVMGQARAQKRQKAELELKSINEAVNLLASFQEYLVSFSAEAVPGKQPSRAKVDEIQKQWENFEKSLPQRSIVWQETAANDFVLSKLVRLAREVWLHSKQTDKLYGEYFSKATAPESELNHMHEAIQSEQAKASDAMVTLKAEIDKTHIQEL